MATEWDVANVDVDHMISGNVHQHDSLVMFWYHQFHIAVTDAPHPKMTGMWSFGVCCRPTLFERVMTLCNEKQSVKSMVNRDDLTLKRCHCNDPDNHIPYDPNYYQTYPDMYN